MSDYKKAPHCGAFLFWLMLVTFSPAKSSPTVDCQPSKKTEKVEVVTVYDGDTLRLRGGRDIRLIGIDTPEMGRNGQPDKTGALDAKVSLQRLIKQSEGVVYLQSGSQPRDRYHRWLAHLYTREGKNLTQEMLQKGLGYQIAVPPNLSHQTCYQNAESEARDAALGLWRNPVQDVSTLKGDETGFYHLRGRIVRVGQSRSALWLNLMGGLAIRITWDDWSKFTPSAPEELVSHNIELRGWLYQRNGEQRVRLRHPSAIRWL